MAEIFRYKRMTEYSQLKQYLIDSVETIEKHNEILCSLKELFKESIDSVRRFEKINSVGQLLKVLEIRDVLTEDNVECLKKLALKLPNSNEAMKNILHFENAYVSREPANYYALTSQNDRKETENSVIATCTIPSTLSRKKHMVLKTVIEKIGSFWRDLGRNLNIRECIIDDIDFQNTTLAAKAKKIMEDFEYKADWLFVLCDALARSRRKDIENTIKKIMVMNEFELGFWL